MSKWKETYVAIYTAHCSTCKRRIQQEWCYIYAGNHDFGTLCRECYEDDEETGQ